MRYLWEAAPARLRAARVEDPRELPDMLRTDLRAGDVVMIKGSLGSRMMPVARALREMFEPSHRLWPTSSPCSTCCATSRSAPAGRS